MATMNVSLPDPMKDWVEAQSKTGRYANASDYVRDLIRRDQARTDKIAEMQRFVDDGIKSGFGSRSRDELFAAATARVQMNRGRAWYDSAFRSKRDRISFPLKKKAFATSEHWLTKRYNDELFAMLELIATNPTGARTP